ncbi:Ig-like domain repeat protein [Methanobrevibacter sp.]
MKFKKIMPIMFALLVILTITAVTATQDIDNITAEDAPDELLELETGDIDTATQTDEKEVLAGDISPNYNIYPPYPGVYGDGSEDDAEIYFYNTDATGNITISINDEEPVYNEEVIPWIYDEYYEDYSGGNFFNFGGVKFNLGENKMTFTYTGDEKYQGFSEEYIIDYYEYTFYVNDDSPWELYYFSEIPFRIYLPDDAKGPVTVKHANRTYKIPYDMYDGYTITLTDFSLGENEIIFSYEDDKYPLQNITRTFHVEPIILVDDFIDYGVPGGIVVGLQSNAKGKLNIYIKGDYNDTIEDYEWIYIDSQAFENGTAPYQIKWELGDYTVKIAYEGDDLKDVLDEDTEYEIQVRPGIVFPYKAYYENPGNITVILPENGNETLKVVVYGLFDENTWEYEYDEIIYNKTANGTVIIPLSPLEIGEYDILVKYGEFENLKEIDVTDERPDFDLNVVFPKTVYENEPEEFRVYTPYEAEGTVTLFVNGEKIQEYRYLDNDYGYEFILRDLKPVNTWQITYTDDEYYRAPSQSGTFEFKKIYVTENITDYMAIYYPAEGFIEVSIDGKPVLNDFFYKETIIDLKNMTPGTHEYEINIYNTTGHLMANQKGTFYMDYEFYADIYYEYSFSEMIEIMVSLPDDANGNILVSYNGKNMTFPVKNGMAQIKLTDLEIGEENITITYGDAKYPQKTLSDVIHINGGEIVLIENDNENILSLTLPEDATGNMIIYKVSYDENREEIKDLFTSVEVINGTATYKFGIGNYRIYAEYNGTDYIVETFDDLIVVLPAIEVSDELMLGENGTINITGRDAPEDFIITLDGEPIFTGKLDENGKINIPINGFDKIGSHIIHIIYNGTLLADAEEFNIIAGLFHVPDVFQSNGTATMKVELSPYAKGNITVRASEDDGYEYDKVLALNVPVSGNTTVLLSSLAQGYYDILIEYIDETYGHYEEYFNDIYVPKPDAGANITIPDTITSDSLDITLQEDAKGSILVTIDGKSQIIPLVNGSAKVDLSNLSAGPHTITVKYSGDEKYSSFEKTSNVTVPNKETPVPKVPAKITAKDLTMQYYDGTKYSVTVYGTDGKVASGVVVTFLIDGKKLGTAKTDGKGVASIKITKTPKTYKITSEALGVKVTKKLTVKQILTLKKVKVKRSAKKLVLTATLKKVKGKYLKGKKITFKFNGKKYTAKTNKKGVAKVTVKNKVLKKLKKGKKVTYTATYLKDTVKKTVKVQK